MHSIAIALAIAVFSVMGNHPCPFPSRVCTHPERYFGCWLKPVGVFPESFSSVLYTMHEEPLVQRHAENGIVRIVFWPSFNLPRMVRFTLNKGSITTVTKTLHFASRTSMPTVVTTSTTSRSDKPPADETLPILRELLCRGTNVQSPDRHDDDGTSVLIELVPPHEGYKAYYFQNFQDTDLFQKVLALVESEGASVHH